MTEIVLMMVMCPPVGDGIVSTVRRGKTTSAVVETLIKMEIASLENAPICSHRTHACITLYTDKSTQLDVYNLSFFSGQNWLFVIFLYFQDKYFSLCRKYDQAKRLIADLRQAEVIFVSYTACICIHSLYLSHIQLVFVLIHSLYLYLFSYTACICLIHSLYLHTQLVFAYTACI